MVGFFLFDDQAYRFKKEKKKLKRKNVRTAKKKKKAIESKFNRYLEKYASQHLITFLQLCFWNPLNHLIIKCLIEFIRIYEERQEGMLNI